MKKDQIQYGVIGLLAGMVLTGFFGAYAVNSNNRGMMGMMGMDSARVMSGNIDRNFIEQMIPHHESAIAMAKLAQQKTKHEEVKTLANNIITSQSAEIETMKSWYKDWFGSEVPVVSENEMWGGMMMNGPASSASLETAADFDEAFLAQMIEHHQMAVMMANMLNVATNRSEMKKLASDIISAQSKEIGDMESWQRQWGYRVTSGGSGMMDTNNMEGMMH